MTKRALVVLSGGQDSTTCLYWALETYAEVSALSFDYGQRHRVELDAARRIAAGAGVTHECILMPGLFRGTSPLTDASRAVERYADVDALPTEGVEDTFVPGRNILFLSVAANRAYVAGADALVIGVAQEDFGGYPDCREDFIRAMEAALSLGLDRALRIETPLMHLNKAETVKLARRLPGCWAALAETHTCYEGEVPACGHCHACLLRARGFAAAGFKDPAMERTAGPGADPA